VLAAVVVAERRSREHRSFDLPGALVLTAGLLFSAYGAVAGGSHGWGSADALVPIAIGAVLLAAFPKVEARAAEPLIPPRAFTRPLRNVNLIVLLFSAALFPMWYLSSLYLQQVLSLTPISTGLCFLPMTLAIMFCAPRAGKLVTRFGARPVLAGGLVLMAAGLALFTQIGTSGSAVQYVVLPGVLTTIGIGFSIVPSTIAATHGAGQEQAGFASGLVNTSRQVGGGLGLAVLISIATLYTTHLIGENQNATEALTRGFRLAFLIAMGLTALSAVLTLVLLRTHSPASGRRFGSRALAVAVVAAVVAFGGVAMALPRSHGAPIGTFTTRGAYSFHSAPNLHPPQVRGGPAAAGERLPGYIMVTNFYDLTKQPMVGQSGPLILNGRLQPVWFQPVPKNLVALNLNRQRYDGAPVLSWWQGNMTATGQVNSGEEVVVNRHYQRLATLRGRDGWVLSPHELLIRGHHAWVTANKNVPADLARYGGVNGGALIDSAVQEYDLRTGRLLYSWKASDHIPPDDSHAQPPANGFPWDAYHVNSISLVGADEFLVSMRNTWAAYLVNIHTGRIVWSLGGRHSSFQLGPGAKFEWQHDVRLQQPSTVTLFDDHCCDITGAGVYLAATAPSRGLILKLNDSHHTARLQHQYSHGLTFQSQYMGNLQTLPNGNAFVGWGEVPYLSEFSHSGRLLFDAYFPTPDMSYRAYVRRWVGEPLYRPRGAAVTRAGGTTVYASWNGATRLSAWRVLAAGADGGPYRTVATHAKAGFETAIALPTNASSFELQALDAGGHVLSTSNPFRAHG
jgi:MFS family permease